MSLAAIWDRLLIFCEDTPEQRVSNKLFNLYNQIKLYKSELYILTSSTCALHDSKLRHDLVTRILSGFVIYLKSVEDQDLFVALKQYVKLECLTIGDIEINYLIIRYTRNLGKLIHLINELSLYAM